MKMHLTHCNFKSRTLAVAVLAAMLSSDLYADPQQAASTAAPSNAPASVAIDASGEQKPSPEQAAADWLEKAFPEGDMPESVRMLVAIARGSQMGPGEGWFGPGQTRYDWKWLAAANGSEATHEIAEDQFRGPKDLFERLDRNRDGKVTASDLDWSDRNPYVQQFNFTSRMLRRLDREGDGRLTRDDMIAVFERAASGRDYVTATDLAEMLLAGFGSTSNPGAGPTPETLVRGLFRGEIGSLNAGPALNAPAPEFVLKTHDGKQTIRLSDLRGRADLRQFYVRAVSCDIPARR